MKEGERGRRRESGGDAKHANTVCICALAFVSLMVQLITFIKPDLELNSWTSSALKLQLPLFPVCTVNAGCGAKIKHF